MKNKLTFKEGQVATFAKDDESGKRTFSMTGYTGAPMRAFGKTKVIIDLKGMSLRNDITPIFQHHDSTKIVGHAKASVAEQVMLNGEISGVGEAAKEVSETAENGFPWQASVGVDIMEVTYLEDGDDEVEVNGHMMSAPSIILSKTELFETSFVPLGKDGDTSVKFSDEEDIKKVFSNKPKEKDMEEKEKVTLEEMRAAFSGNLEFACDCFQEDLSLIEAKAKFADVLAEEVVELRNEITELKASQTDDTDGEGETPVGHIEAGLGGEVELSPKEEAEAKLSEYKEAGKGILAFAKDHPEFADILANNK